MMSSSRHHDGLLSCSRRIAGDTGHRGWSVAGERASPSCPRCDSPDTKFCYYNNYSLSQPRYFCKGCRRYWTKGGSLRNVPVGGGSRRKACRGNDFRRRTPPPSSPPPPPAAPPLRADMPLQEPDPAADSACSSESSSCNQMAPRPLTDEVSLLDQATLAVDLLPSTNVSSYLVHQELEEHIDLGIINYDYWSSLDNYSSSIGGFL